jgi:hypothetical protein
MIGVADLAGIEKARQQDIAATLSGTTARAGGL